MNKVKYNHKGQYAHECLNISDERVSEIEQHLEDTLKEIESGSKENGPLKVSVALEKFFDAAENENELAYIAYVVGIKQGEVRAMNRMHKHDDMFKEPEKKSLPN